MGRGMDIENGGKWSAITRLVFWAALTFTMVMATMPKPPPLATPSDKVNHIIAFFVLTALHQVAYRDFGFWRRMLMMTTLGGVIELVQMVPSLNRDAEWMDWLADVVAAFVASCLVSLAMPNKATNRSEP
jgi:VanZ family protein